MLTHHHKHADEPLESVALLEQVFLKSRGRGHKAERRQAGGAATLLEGRIEEFLPAEVLQILDYRGRGELVVTFHDAEGVEKGRIWIQDHTLLHARSGRHEGVKAFTRLLGLEKGTFVVEPGPLPPRLTIVAKLDRMLLRSLVHIDEQRSLAAELTASGRYHTSDEAIVLEADDPAVHVLALADTSAGLQDLLDVSPYTDIDTLKLVRLLVDSGALVAETPAS